MALPFRVFPPEGLRASPLADPLLPIFLGCPKGRYSLWTVARDPGVAAHCLDGAEDCITPVGQHTQLIYDNLVASVPRSLVRFTQGDHCGFGQVGGPGQGECETAEQVGCICGLPPAKCQGTTLGGAVQTALTAEHILPWLDAHLAGVATAEDVFAALLDDSRTTVQAVDP